MRERAVSLPALTEIAHRAVARAFEARALPKGGDGVPAFPFAVDATAGNGYDAVFLARQVGEGGLVAAFDVQEAALAATRDRLAAEGLLGRVRLVRSGHEHMERELARLFPALELRGKVTAIMFNLGFLPGSDKAVTTAAPTTVAALDAASRLLTYGGVLSAHVYTGHRGGMEEDRAVLAWSAALSPEEWRVLSLSQPNKARNLERLILAERLFPKGKGGAGRP